MLDSSFKGSDKCRLPTSSDAPRCGWAPRQRSTHQMHRLGTGHRNRDSQIAAATELPVLTTSDSTMK
uniref:Uncharacterized protein n=1 Tax=Strongyloides papillosus TaxID=174720 RepID=A0A0N5BMP9_STREA